MRKINGDAIKKGLYTIGRCAGNVGKVALYGLLTAVTCNSITDLQKIIRYSGTVGYGEAADAIMNSSMWSSEKSKALSSLKPDGDCEYYKAIISIVESTMWSSEKLKTIVNLSEKTKEL